MVGAVLTLIWLQVPSVQELTRMLQQHELLWGKAVLVSQQALSQRFLGFPAELFERVFHHLLPQLLFPLASPTKTTSSSRSHIRT